MLTNSECVKILLNFNSNLEYIKNLLFKCQNSKNKFANIMHSKKILKLLELVNKFNMPLDSIQKFYLNKYLFENYNLDDILSDIKNKTDIELNKSNLLYEFEFSNKKSKNAVGKDIHKKEINKKIFSDSMKKRWQNKEYKEKNLANRIKTINTKEYKRKISKIRKNTYIQNPHIITKIANSVNAFYSDINNKKAALEKMKQTKISNFKLKKVFFNGKEFFLQGYEPQVLKYILKFYDVNNITNNLSINYVYENKNKIYYPDFYIKSDNLIIEVKSLYTYKVNLKNVLVKKRACLNLGYNYNLIIYNDRKSKELSKEINYV